MKQYKMRISLVALAVSLSIAAQAQSDKALSAVDRLKSNLPEGQHLAAVKTRTLKGQGFTFVKIVDDQGNITEKILNPAGKPIPEQALPAIQISKMGSRLKQMLDRAPGHADYIPDDADVDVYIALADPTDEEDGAESLGESSIVNGYSTTIIDGNPVSNEEIEFINDARFEEIAAQRENRELARRSVLKELAQRNNLENYPSVRAAIKAGRGALTLPIKKYLVAGFLEENDDLIAGMDLAEPPQNTLNSAMVATNVNPYAINSMMPRGNGIGIYMSEGGCPEPSWMSGYRRLSGSADNHSRNVLAILRGVSPNSYLYCRGGYTLPTSSDINGYSGNPRVYVQTHSWRTSTSNSYGTLDRDFENSVYNNLVPIFHAAGNEGYGSGNVTSPAKSLNTITLGNYNDSNDSINPGSSYKDPDTGNEKPEISAPGTNVCTRGATSGSTICMTGTSQATPHAAAFAADLMSSYGWLKLKPQLVKSFMLAGATDAIAGGIEKVGLGGIDYYSAYYGGHDFWMQGGNSSYASYDASDIQPNNGTIDFYVYLTSGMSQVRAVLSWLNRGSFTYSHRYDAHPIGMDLDLAIYDPNGNYVTGSASWDNPYEVVNFEPSMTGYYVFKIRRYANRDTSSKFYAAMSVNW
jgi:hypothetical protein